MSRIIKLYNTMTQKKEKFHSIEKSKIKFYCCGPTVYDYIHIGNARTFVMFDALRRFLEYLGYEVNYVQNLTDVDDKIIKKARELGISTNEVSEIYIKEYLKDSGGLGIKPPTANPKVTENIEEIVKYIEKLFQNNLAYRTSNGVYFRVRKFQKYSSLSKQKLDSLASGARVESDLEKEDSLDFVLWKFKKDGEPYWKSPWGDGRPGWHIECTVMANLHLGQTIDIHTGGIDLIFPHHENEIAQFEALTGNTFCNYWLHNGHMNINNQKMSKSLGNFFTVQEIAKEYGYDSVRFFLLLSHYRSSMNFEHSLIESAKNGLERLWNFKKDLEFLMKTQSEKFEFFGESDIALEDYKKRFIEALADDFNTPVAISYIFELMNYFNKSIHKNSVKTLELFSEMCDILGILYSKKSFNFTDDINDLIKKRQKAREDKDWKTSDILREELKTLGVIIKDTKNGQNVIHNVRFKEIDKE